MSVTGLTEVTNQVKTFWSELFMDELRNSLLLGAIANKDYQGEITSGGGNTVRVSQINAPTGQNRTVGTDADTFDTEALSTSYVDVAANKRAVAAFEFDDLAKFQSQIKDKDGEIRKALVYGVAKQMNTYLYSLIAPSASSPDHIINSVTDFNAAKVADARMRAAIAKWPKEKPWYILADPSFYTDMLNATTLTSQDYVGGEAPVIGGQVVNKRFGFGLLEDNSLATDQAIALYEDALLMVMQKDVNIKISDLHAQKKFGFVISADIVYGGKLGINGSKKCQLICADASATTVVMA